MTTNQTAIITGASRGIGREIALAFARAGYNVAAIYHNEEAKALDVKDIVEAAGVGCGLFKCDVSDSVSVKNTVKAVFDNFANINVLINNAAMARDSMLANMTNEDWDRVVTTGLNGPFFLMRECLPLMKNGGAIINISSIAGVRGNFGGANYAAAKGGLISLTKTAAKECDEKGITVNAILPGFHLTDMGRVLPQKYADKLKAESVLNVTTDINELSEFVVFLSKMKTVSGQVFNWDSRII
jgi:3-oxoacyl-[acyl-carrier protein] reductase